METYIKLLQIPVIGVCALPFPTLRVDIEFIQLVGIFQKSQITPFYGQLRD